MLSFLISICLSIAANAQLTILQPESLRSLFSPNGTVECTLGDFGFVPYGQSLVTVLQVADPFDGCNLKPIQDKDQYAEHQAILIQRGGCSFAQKSSGAEQAGYTIVVIADSKDEQISQILMVNKNYSLSVNIPTILIGLKDGERIANYLKANPKAPVYLKLYIEPPKPTTIVKYEYWMSSLDAQSIEFIEQFKPFHQKLGDQVVFTPHYVMWEDPYCRQNNFTLKNPHCLSGGRYCDFDPDQAGPLDGRDVIIQNLRQLCIYKNYPVEWWVYMINFKKECLGYLSGNVDICAAKVQNAVPGINTDLVQKCVYDGFAKKEKAQLDSDDNTILRDERQTQLQVGILTFPTLVVNDQQYRGALTLPYHNGTDNLPVLDIVHYGPLQIICQAYDHTALPQLCKERLRMFVDDDGNLTVQPNTSTNWTVWIFAIVALAILMLFTIYCYRRQMRKAMQQELQLQVNMAISQYFSLNEKEKNFMEIK